MTKLLEGKRAIVTGGAGGIGSGIVAGLLEAGAKVVAVGRSAKVDQLVEALAPEGGRLFAVTADVSSESGCDEGFEQAMGHLGGVDILITAHGHVRPQPSMAVDREDWEITFATNLTAVFRLSQLAFADMEPRKQGKIIHIASMYAFFGGFRVAAYAASKGAVGQLTKSLAIEWAASGVNVNAIAPGYIKTSLNRHIWADPERAGQVLSRIPAGRWGEPVDLVGTVLFLASEMSDYVHGVVLPVDGGYLAR